MENKTNKNQKQSGISPAVRIGSLIMAGLMILGAHMYDCKENSALALNFSFLGGNPILRKSVHRFAGIAWLMSGLAVIMMAMLTDLLGMIACAVGLCSLAAPWFYGRSKAAKTL